MLKFIDLFCGLGGLRLGFESACKSANIECKCVLSSEIKKTAIETYQLNFLDSIIEGDITGINIESMPDFDFLLAGFPCQPFSSAGTRQGFLDTRGTLFFEIEKILSKKKPYGFLLENVDNLEKHDQGKTLANLV
jgi:DNA (cytosine-5)-methyltransferase 1